MQDYIDSYDILYTEVIGLSKDIREKSEELATLLFQMKKLME